jgi:hypothetical protein
MAELLWYGSAGRVASTWRRLRRDLRAREEERRVQHGNPNARGPAHALGLAACVCFVLAVTVGAISGDRARVTSRGSPPAPAAPFEQIGITIPDVRGTSAADARVRLEQSGLDFAGVTPKVGAPGQVLATYPSVGRSVSPGTSVTVVVGVEPERLRSE